MRGVFQDASATIGASQVTLLAADPQRTGVFICNGSASNTLAVNLAGGTAAINGAGCITLAAGGSIFADIMVPTGAITGIGSNSSTIATVQFMQGGT